jgi:mono/diheme cytochrome c family protein
MRLSSSRLAVAIWLGGSAALYAFITPPQAANVPPPASQRIDFEKEIKPIFEGSCIECHGRGKSEGGFKIDSRKTLLKGGDSGPAVVTGKSAGSLLIELVQSSDPDTRMPKKGSHLTPRQINSLRAWIDQGAPWSTGVTFGRLEPKNLKPRRPSIPPGPKDANPIDLFLAPYFAAHHIKPAAPVNDRTFARRVYLDAIGLLPSAKEMSAFVADQRSDKRARLVRTLLADKDNYALHWMTFWNDALRNDYRGTGYIDGGRKQITRWLYGALVANMPYDRFVAQLVNPTSECEGFSKGIVWRGAVNASQTPQMQTAQNIAQVFMGVNLKCASCHNSFINDLTLADAYGLAGIYSAGPLEMVRCDKPTGKTAPLKFLYPELGEIDPTVDKAARLKRLAEIITGPNDGRLTRTIVNRYWQKFMGRGLVEPVDDMEKAAWNADLLDSLASDLVDRHYDLKHLIEVILTSRAYQMPAVQFDEKNSKEYVFAGPLVRRMSAEQFRDALGELTGVWCGPPAAPPLDVAPAHSKTPRKAPLQSKGASATKWIWNTAHAEAAAKPGTVYFRKTIKIENRPSRAIAFATADNSFTLYVNGEKSGAGDDWTHPSILDITKNLVQGENTIAVAATNGGNQPNPAGLFVYLRLQQNEPGKPIKNLVTGTDASWSWSVAKAKDWETPGFDASNWKHANELGDATLLPWRMEPQLRAALVAEENPASFGKVRAVLVNADALQVALGRPNREQTVTVRNSVATTLEALALTNGRELADILRRGAKNVLKERTASREELISNLYVRALGRVPTAEEAEMANDVVGQPPQPAGVEDLLWALVMLPEFQLIY